MNSTHNAKRRFLIVSDRRGGNRKRLKARIGRSKTPMLILAALLILSAGQAVADCYFIGLREFQMAKGADPFQMGDLSPMIAMEPGRFYSLAPEHTDLITHGLAQLGRRYYIPQHLIGTDGHFTLRVMVVDRDLDTSDDLVLPLTEWRVSLMDTDFKSDTRRVALHSRPFNDDRPAQPNSMRLVFEVEKRDGRCGEDSAPGRMADAKHRRNNELKRLMTRVTHYDQPHLVGGWEYLPYRLPKINKAKRSSALEKAFNVAEANARELITLGQEIRELRDSPEFPEVWAAYAQLLERLTKQVIVIHFKDADGVRRKVVVPSLAFQDGWKGYLSAEFLPVVPENWGIAAQ